MAISRERIKAIAKIETAADVGWKERMKKRRLHKQQQHWRYGGINTYCVFDEAMKEISFSVEHGREPIVFTREEIVLPAGLRVKGGPTSVFISDGFTLNPASNFPSTIITPTPTLIPAPSPLDGMLGAITAILGGQ